MSTTLNELPSDRRELPWPSRNQLARGGTRSRVGCVPDLSSQQTHRDNNLPAAADVPPAAGGAGLLCAILAICVILGTMLTVAVALHRFVIEELSRYSAEGLMRAICGI